MRASPPERRSRERCCATTLSINTGLWISRWSPTWASAAGGLTVHALCGIECLSGVRSPSAGRSRRPTSTAGTSRSRPPDTGASCWPSTGPPSCSLPAWRCSGVGRPPTPSPRWRPTRVRSLTSIMSTTGNDQVGQPTDAARALFLLPPVNTREGAMDRAVLFNRIVGSPAYPTEETELRDRAVRAFDRSFNPQGVARQLAAAMTTPDRTEDLRRLDLPTLVIHGAEDPLICRERRAGDRKSDSRSGAGRNRRHGSRPAPTAVAHSSRAHCNIGRTRSSDQDPHKHLGELDVEASEWAHGPSSFRGHVLAHLSRRFQRPSRLRPRARTNARWRVDAPMVWQVVVLASLLAPPD